MSDLILGVDPGGTTGVVVLDWRGLLVVEHDQLDLKTPEDPLWAHWLRRIVPMVELIAAERFFITLRTIKLTRQYDALDVLGTLRYLSVMECVPVRLQSASDAKTAFSDETLKSLGLFHSVKGGHARDALRHALLASRHAHKNV